MPMLRAERHRAWSPPSTLPATTFHKVQFSILLFRKEFCFCPKFWCVRGFFPAEKYSCITRRLAKQTENDKRGKKQTEPIPPLTSPSRLWSSRTCLPTPPRFTPMVVNRGPGQAPLHWLNLAHSTIYSLVRFELTSSRSRAHRQPRKMRWCSLDVDRAAPTPFLVFLTGNNYAM